MKAKIRYVLNGQKKLLTDGLNERKAVLFFKCGISRSMNAFF